MGVRLMGNSRKTDKMGGSRRDSVSQRSARALGDTTRRKDVLTAGGPGNAGGGGSVSGAEGNRFGIRDLGMGWFWLVWGGGLACKIAGHRVDNQQ